MIKNLIIIASLTINLAFIYYLFQGSDGGARRPDGKSEAAVKAASTPTLEQPGLDSDRSSTGVDYQAPGSEGGYAALARQLRESDLPEDLVRQLVLAAVDRDYLLERRDAEMQPAYWQRAEPDHHQTVLKELAWREEKRTLLREIFGDAIIDDPLFEDLFKPLNDSLAFLSSDKQISLDNLIRESRARNADFQGLGFIREFRDERRTASEDLRRTIQELLTEDEYFEYQLRESRLADTMRRTMEGFDYSEQEFRDLYRTRSDLTLSTSSTADFNREEYLAARLEAEDRIRDYLGDDRFEEYQRRQDPLYRSLQSIGEIYGTNAGDLTAIYDVTKNTNGKLQALSRNREISVDERRRAIEQIREDFRAEVVDIAGEEIAASVQQNIGRFTFRGLGSGQRPRRGQ